MARGGKGGADGASTHRGKSQTHGTRGGAKRHIPKGSGKKMHGKVSGGRGTKHAKRK